VKKKFNKSNFMEELYEIVSLRAKCKDKNSYTKKLIKRGPKKIAQKISEESIELIIDYINGSKQRVVEETADLIYHMIVLLYSKKITIKKIENELKKRRKNVR
jgi:phosphoribosyl-ATP pyrophosphohydrolase